MGKALPPVPKGKAITGSITKEMDRRFISSMDLIGMGEWTATIDRVEKHDVLKFANGNAEENAILLYFRETPKPLMLCNTNIKYLIVLCESSKVSDWAGKKVTMHTEKVLSFGKMVDAIRFCAGKSGAAELNKRLKGPDNEPE